MINKFLYVFITFFFVFNSINAQKQLEGFRNFKWNVTPEEIRENEDARFMQTFEGFDIYAISYRDKFADERARIDYTFKENKLVEGSYQFTFDEDVEEKFIKIRDELISKNGKPNFWAIKKITDEHIWVRETNLGSSRGPELYWQFDNGFIGIQTSSYKEEYTITIIYVSNKTLDQYRNQDIFTTEY